VHKSKLKRIALAVCFAFLPFSAHSAGLGKLTVISGLGEPLRAEIDLVSTTPEELSSLTAAIAPQEAYAVQGIERRSVHSAIQVDVVKKPDGTAMLKLSTRQPIDDPFLDMLIQLDWATGRLLREYTVLLDPPGYANVQPPVVTTQTAPARTSPPISSTPLATPSSSSVARTAAEPNRETEYTTKSGDNLSKIAKEMQLDGYSLDQMLVALYRANPQAFDGDNMNRLKVGQIIKAPTYDDLSAVTPQEAAKEIRVQTSDWNAYRSRLAGVVAESAPMAEDGGDQATTGRLKTATEDRAAPVETGPKDVVKLSKSETDKTVATNTDAKALQDKLSAMQEENIARQKSVAEANERVAMLEKQIADLQALLTIKDKTLAGLQDNATVTNETAPEVAGQAPETAAEAAATTEAKPTEQVEAAPVVEAAPASEIKPKPAAKKRPIAEPVAEPSLLDGLADNAMLLALAGGAVLLLGGGWVFMRNRRKHNLDSFEQGILTAGGLKANTVFGNTSGGTVDTGDTSFLTDFSQSPSGMIDTHDVDPIAEAEVYMAYGRDSQAEEILNDAISKEPTRYELHLKLLEIFAGRNDTSAFEAVAGELYSTLGSSDPVWVKVAEMGHKMEPTNPLYDLSTGHSATSKTEAVSAVAATSAVMASAVETTKLDASDFINAEVMTEASLDFSLDAEPAKVDGDAEKPSTEDSSLDFNLGFDANETEVESGPSEALVSMEDTAQFEVDAKQNNDKQSNEISFDMDFGAKADEPELAITAPSATKPEASKTEETIQFDTPVFSETLPNLELPNLNVAEETSQAVTSESNFLDLTGLADDTKTLSIAEPESPKETVKEESSGLDFNFDLGSAEHTAIEASEINIESVLESEDSSANSLEMDLSGISLDMDVSDTSSKIEQTSDAEDELEEVNTKLDLVTAYMDMGDAEGARELLDEVLKEGGAKQRERAQALLNSLA
jgi:pilus assembly protein FimV